jgi:hypothetical protein
LVRIISETEDEISPVERKRRMMKRNNLLISKVPSEGSRGGKINSHFNAYPVLIKLFVSSPKIRIND